MGDYLRSSFNINPSMEYFSKSGFNTNTPVGEYRKPRINGNVTESIYRRSKINKKQMGNYRKQRPIEIQPGASKEIAF
jgi:hypothetical protein